MRHSFTYIVKWYAAASDHSYHSEEVEADADRYADMRRAFDEKRPIRIQVDGKDFFGFVGGIESSLDPDGVLRHIITLLPRPKEDTES